MADEEEGEVQVQNAEINKLSYSLFIKKTKLYFKAVVLNDEKKQRFALLFNLNEDAFRLAESVQFAEGVNTYKNWIKKLKSL